MHPLPISSCRHQTPSPMSQDDFHPRWGNQGLMSWCQDSGVTPFAFFYQADIFRPTYQNSWLKKIYQNGPTTAHQLHSLWIGLNKSPEFSYLKNAPFGNLNETSKDVRFPNKKSQSPYITTILLYQTNHPHIYLNTPRIANFSPSEKGLTLRLQLMVGRTLQSATALHPRLAATSLVASVEGKWLKWKLEQGRFGGTSLFVGVREGWTWLYMEHLLYLVGCDFLLKKNFCIHSLHQKKGLSSMILPLLSWIKHLQLA